MVNCNFFLYLHSSQRILILSVIHTSKMEGSLLKLGHDSPVGTYYQRASDVDCKGTKESNCSAMFLPCP